jgi:hypothetical protein
MGKRLSLSFVVFTVMGLVLPLMAQQSSPRVSILVPTGDQVSRRPFVVHLENRLSIPIVYCTDFGHCDEFSTGVIGTFDPFYIQRRTNRRWRRRWEILLNGWDVGGGRFPFFFDPNHSEDYTYHVNSPGLYRLQLIYASRDNEAKCELPRKDSTTVTSMQFLVR